MSRVKPQRHRRGLHPISVLPLGCLCVAIVGTLLLMLPVCRRGPGGTPFFDALFTATSASCVTGLTVVEIGSYFTLLGQIVILLLIQVGGLGFMTMSTILFAMTKRKISLYERITMAQNLGESRLQGAVKLTRTALFVTLAAEGAGVLLLAPRFIRGYGFFKGIWYSIFHSVSAFCNAGFDLVGGNRSLADFSGDPYLLFVLMALIVLGGLGFAVIINIWQKRRFKYFRLHTKLVLIGTAGLIIVGALLFLILEYNNPQTLGGMSFGHKVVNALFQSVTLRTAGFASINQHAMHDASKGISIILMAIGGAPAGTAGGFKITTIITLVLAVLTQIRGRFDTTAFGRTIPHTQVRRALTVFFIGTLTLVSMTILMSAAELGTAAGQYGMLNQFFEVTSALCTVGVTSGVTAVADTLSRGILIFLMFVGRVGLLTLAVAVVSVSESTPALRYPSEDILIG